VALVTKRFLRTRRNSLKTIDFIVFASRLGSPADPAFYCIIKRFDFFAVFFFRAVVGKILDSLTAACCGQRFYVIIPPFLKRRSEASEADKSLKGRRIMKRLPAVAGTFYPSDPAVLRRQVESYLDPRAKKQEAIGLVSPHAGFNYSGPVAGAAFSSVELPDTFIILCPNHRGWGAPIAIMSRGEWVTPLGEVAVDSELADALKQTTWPTGRSTRSKCSCRFCRS
jgi:hypothetical protein